MAAIRRGPERSKYKNFKHSFDYFWRNNWKENFYHKDADNGFGWLPFDAEVLYKWNYTGIEYKACTNKAKFTFSAMKDLDKEVKWLKIIEKCWGTGWVVVLFPTAKITKYYTPDFVIENFEKQLAISSWWEVLPAIRDERRRPIWDISVLL